MVKIISEIGYCTGVKQAIEKLSKAGKKSDKVFLLHPILHNIKENNYLMKNNNAVYLDKNSQIDENSTLLFSAHGYRFKDYLKYSNKMNIEIATCPIILSRYKLLEKQDKELYYIFLGKDKHEETMAFLDNFPFLHFMDSKQNLVYQINKMQIKNKNIFFIPQTTISNKIKEDCISLLEKENNIVKKLDICLSYFNRIKEIDCFLSMINNRAILFIIGDKLSSNANEIYDFVKNKYNNIEVYIENSFKEIREKDLNNKDIYLTSATSTSKENVETIKKQIENYLVDLM